MTPRLTCEEARELVPEMALGTIAGDDRARLIAHISSCASCRVLVEELSEVADSLLLLGPEHEPPGGFESAVLAGFKAAPPTSRRMKLLMAAAAVLIALVAAGSVLWVTADERELAAHYEHALEEANGEYFGVKPLVTIQGSKVGNVFAYEGHPSWVFVVFAEDVDPATYTAELVTADERTDLGAFTLGAGDRTWGTDVDAELKDVIALRFTSSEGEILEARFDAP